MPTDKRIKHIERQKKKLSGQRSMEERALSVSDILTRLNGVPIPYGMKVDKGYNSFLDVPEIKKFLKIIDNFVETGNTHTGIIKIPDFGHNLIYQFYANKKLEVAAMLKAITEED